MTSSTHVVAFAAMAWGHNKSLLILLGRMAGFRPSTELTLTILTGEPILTKVLAEVKSMPSPIAGRINVIDVGASVTLFEPQVGFNPIFKDLWTGEPVFKVGAPEAVTLPRPSVVILDPMNGFAIPVIKEASAGACPILAWYSGPMSTIMSVIGPEYLGGVGDLAAKIEAAVKETGKTPVEVADSVAYKYEGLPHDVPGIPPMYDYDFFPQELNFPFPIALGSQFWHRDTMACDGVIAVTASAFEVESIKACRAWLEGAGKQTFVFGPLENVPSKPVSSKELGVKQPKPLSNEDARIIAFLDQKLAQFGPRSVIYLAFGTMFYPKDSSKLEAAFDEIIASNTPVLWGHASPFAVISKSLEDKFAAAPNAFHADWTPQQRILGHPAVGWFVTHGGWNSIQEALSLKVPLIMWPFAGDQPANAAILGTTHGAAFELFSVRSGKATRQPRRLEGQKLVDYSIDGVRQEVRELLVKLKGPEGVQVRKNAEKLGASMATSWEQGGEANLQVETFLQKYARA